VVSSHFDTELHTFYQVTYKGFDIKQNKEFHEVPLPPFSLLYDALNVTAAHINLLVYCGRIFGHLRQIVAG
jgi:hypothetical protein